MGHVDSADRGPGALFRLDELGPGAFIESVAADGSVARWAVSARATYQKSVGLPENLFDLTGPRQLVLITCGGAFDAATGSYEENVVVLANPTT